MNQASIASLSLQCGKCALGNDTNFALWAASLVHVQLSATFFDSCYIYIESLFAVYVEGLLEELTSTVESLAVVGELALLLMCHEVAFETLDCAVMGRG